MHTQPVSRVICFVLMLFAAACSNNPSASRTLRPGESPAKDRPGNGYHPNPACERFMLLPSPEIKPARIVRSITPAVPTIHRSNGYACVQATVDLSGGLVGAEILATSDEEFAKAALRAMSRWRYAPATRDGVPVRTRVLIDFWYVRKGWGGRGSFR